MRVLDCWKGSSRKVRREGRVVKGSSNVSPYQSLLDVVERERY